MKIIRSMLLLLCLALAAGCSSHQGIGAFDTNDDEATASSLDDDDKYLDDIYATQLVPDPLESWNRAMFVVNNGFITYIGRPVNAVYTTVMPSPFRDGLNNFFSNLFFPVRFVNNLLQGKGQAAGKEFGRFIINTSAGLGGFVNIAKTNPDLQNLDDEDFGQTLGVWGISEGVYLYWPLIGPSSARDTVGRIGDWGMDPLTYTSPWWVPMATKGLRTVNELDDILNLYDNLTKSAIEPYTAVRDAYIQYRRAKIAK